MSYNVSLDLHRHCHGLSLNCTFFNWFALNKTTSSNKKGGTTRMKKKFVSLKLLGIEFAGIGMLYCCTQKSEKTPSDKGIHVVQGNVLSKWMRCITRSGFCLSQYNTIRECVCTVQHVLWLIQVPWQQCVCVGVCVSVSFYLFSAVKTTKQESTYN